MARSARFLLTSTIAACLLALSATAGSATAATAAPCFDAFDHVDCLSYSVPLDRSGSIAGNARVEVIRVPAIEGPRLGAIFLIAGGPGQPSQVMLDFMMTLFPGANRYDLVAVDQRGTGFSEPLNCPEIERGPVLDGADSSTDRPITQCANRLGAARATYNTAAAIADLETVRADMGIEKITLFGVSYGTKVALAYAKAYPTHVQALLIDSVLPVNEPSAFDTVSLDAMRKSLAELCSGSRCKGILSSPVSQVARLAAQLAREPVEGIRLIGDRPVKLKLKASELYALLFSADFNLFIYEQLPSAVRAALAGNSEPLLRLAEISGIGESDDEESAKRRAGKPRSPDVTMFSDTLNVTTSCEDFAPPWARGAALGTRQPAIDAAATAISDAQFLPFDRTTVKNDSLAAICRGWPESPTQPALPAGPLPEVPVLALNGSLDVRTPVAWAQQAIAGNPKAQLVVIPHTGHSTIGTDVSGCALSLAKRFLIFGATDGVCRRKPQPVPVAPVSSSSSRGVKALRGSCRGKKLRGRRCSAARKTVTAGYLALRDALDQYVIGGAESGPGLYSGSWELDIDIEALLFGDPDAPVLIKLDAIEHVPGVLTDGRINITRYPKVTGTYTVDDVFGRAYRVSFSGRVAYDQRRDRLVLRASSRGAVVTLRRGGSGSTAAAGTAATLHARSAFAVRALGKRALRVR